MIIFQWLVRFLMAHAVTDYALQSMTVSTNKSRHAPPPPDYDPKLHGPLQTTWPYYMFGHAAVNAAGVYLFSGGNISLAVLEFGFHSVIDILKTERVYGVHVDQALHFATKLFYAALLYWGVF